MNDQKLNIKQELLALCHSFIEARINSTKIAIQMAQNSANEETKSTAGDKFETGRAMAQLEIEKGTVQLAEALKQKQVLDYLLPETTFNTVRMGSLVYTNQGNYYVSIPAGRLEVDSIIYYAISSISPIGALLFGLKTGGSINFNSKIIIIKEIV